MGGKGSEGDASADQREQGGGRTKGEEDQPQNDVIDDGDDDDNNCDTKQIVHDRRVNYLAATEKKWESDRLIRELNKHGRLTGEGGIFIDFELGSREKNRDNQSIYLGDHFQQWRPRAETRQMEFFLSPPHKPLVTLLRNPSP